MQNYLKNNLTLINKYQELYEKEINIDTVIEKFTSGELLSNTCYDYARFRVFIDSCLLLFNKEKLNFFMAQEYSFKFFIDQLEKSDELKSYIDLAKNQKLIPNESCYQLFYSLENKVHKPWNQVTIIRNAMAHMQYGHFMQQEQGLLLCYGIFNKDKGVRKEIGVVVEPVLHSFIYKFFSNYSFGIPYKHTFFSNYSFAEKKNTNEMIFYEVTARKNHNEIYTGFNNNSMKELAKEFKKDALDYLKKHEEDFDIKENKVSDITEIQNYNIVVTKRNICDKHNYYYGLKVFLDPETEISNFLIHIGQLNQELYEYSLICNSGQYGHEQIIKYKEQLVAQLEELKEDTNAKLAFDLGFAYLKAMNFALRLEDNDLKPLDFSICDVSSFIYADEALQSYCENNGISQSGKQRYVAERIRNALMHGKIFFCTDVGGNIYFIFRDEYNKRKDEIKVSLEKLENFLSQDFLYQGVPEGTPMIRI